MPAAGLLATSFAFFLGVGSSVATGVCGVPDDVSAFLIGHAPEAMSQYLLRWALSSGDAIKEAQAKISATTMRSLHGAERKRAA